MERIANHLRVRFSNPVAMPGRPGAFMQMLLDQDAVNAALESRAKNLG